MNAMQPSTQINTQFLNESVLEEAAGASVFARGRKLVGAVTILACDENIAHATVQGSLLYQVSMQWEPMLFGICTCPYNFEGDFCKHLVALGLALLNAADTAQSGGDPVIDPLAEELKWLLRRRGFIGYSEALDFADEIEDFCNTLEYQLEQDYADAVAPLALKLTTRLRSMLQGPVDDSGGAVGDACQRALEIYAAACVAGNPDGRKLGRWLAKFNLESPGWPDAPLNLFLPALGTEGFSVYRKAVLKAREAAVASAVHDWELYTVNHLYLEILDADGDVDGVVELLSGGEAPQFAGIIRRLEGAGRHREAMDYLDRAIAAERIVAPSTVYVGDVENESFLTPGGVVELLLADGRCQDAQDFCWWVFQKWPQKHTYRLCLDVADKCGNLAAERRRLLEFIDQHPWHDGSIPISIALSDDDLERAWAAARRWGAGSYWDTLVGLVPQPYPLDALDVYFERMQLVLSKTGRKSSRECARLLKKAFSLARFADASASAEQGVPVSLHGERFAEIVSGLRKAYGNRPTLMEELRRAGFIS